MNIHTIRPLRELIGAVLCFCAVTLGPIAATTHYSYDDAGRLSQADYGAEGSISYTYDNAGNLLRVVTSAGLALSVSQVSNSQVTLSWAASPSNAILESSDHLSVPPQWSAVASVPVTNGNQKTITVSTSTATKFYRLRIP